MKSRLGLVAIALLLVPAAGVRGASEVSFQEMRPGVWAAVQPEGSFFSDSNAVVLISEEDVLVVDSQADIAGTRALIERIREQTGLPVRYLVNTHFHSDHTRSNFVYREAFPNLEIIGHEHLRSDIPERSAPELEGEIELFRSEIAAGEERLARGLDRSGATLDQDGRARLASQIARAKTTLATLESIRWELPSLTVRDGLVLHRSLGPIEIRPFRAHTRGDLIVYLPKARVLVTGDILDELPYAGHGYLSDWVAVLAELDGLEWDVLIPGHGRVREGAEARRHLTLVRSLFELMLSEAREAALAGLALEAATQAFLTSPSLAPVKAALVRGDEQAERAFSDFAPDGFERAYLEANGRPLD